MPAPTTPPTISDLPTAPTRGSAADGDTFVALADAWNAAIPDFGDDLTAVADWARDTADDVYADALTASAAAASAIAANGASAMWVSGTT